MIPVPPSVRVGAPLAVLALTAAIATGLAPSGAATDDAVPSTAFAPVNSGVLPTAAPSLQEPHASLSTAERGYAIQLAQRSLPDGSTDVLGNTGGEVLAVELPPLGERDADRRAVVSLYNYTDNKIVEVATDLTTSQTTRRELVGLQLPPSAAEASVATQLALDVTPALDFIEQYRTLTGTPLVSAAQVTTVAGVWRPQQGTEATGAAADCGNNRCLQLLLALPSGGYLSTRDFIVDLTRHSIVPATVQGAAHEH